MCQAAGKLQGHRSGATNAAVSRPVWSSVLWLVPTK